MADFSIESTKLSDPQGSGTSPVAAVQEKAVNTSPIELLTQIGDVFAKGLANSRKKEAEQRKNAILGEYTTNEATYVDALTSGQWNSSHHSAASKANFLKMITAYPEYAKELTEQRTAVFSGTEAGASKDNVETQAKLRQKNIEDAQANGIGFYENEDKASVNAKLEAHNTSVRIQKQIQETRARNAEERASESHVTSQTIAQNNIRDHKVKQEAIAGMVEVASKNFDSLFAEGDDLFKKVSSGSMDAETAERTHGININRVKTAALSVSASNPEVAAPWIALITQMQETFKSTIDPAKKSDNERKLIENEWAILKTKGMLLAANGDPELKKAVIAQALFPTTALTEIANSPAITKFLNRASTPDKDIKNPSDRLDPMVDTSDAPKLYKLTQDALNALQSGKTPEKDREKASQQAVSLVSNMLKQTADKQGTFNPESLKVANKFYASPEFGKLMREGKISKEVAAQAQQVFQVQYNPVIKDGVLKILDSRVPNVRDGNDSNMTLSDNTEIKVVGGQVVFQPKPIPSDLGYFDANREIANRTVHKKDLEKASVTMNQLIRMHANLEGEADYGKYWEANKHILLPGVFVEGYKVGGVYNGYTYLGGDARSPNSYKKVGK